MRTHLEAWIANAKEMQRITGGSCLKTQTEAIAVIEKLKEALEFVRNDLDVIGITPTELSHLAKLTNALAIDPEKLEK